MGATINGVGWDQVGLSWVLAENDKSLRVSNYKTQLQNETNFIRER